LKLKFVLIICISLLFTSCKTVEYIPEVRINEVVLTEATRDMGYKLMLNEYEYIKVRKVNKVYMQSIVSARSIESIEKAEREYKAQLIEILTPEQITKWKTHLATGYDFFKK
jgi:hypothetical protein